MTRLTPKQRETLDEIAEDDVQVQRMRSKHGTRETWVWHPSPYAVVYAARAGLPIPPSCDMSARELKRLRLLTQRGLIGMPVIERWGIVGGGRMTLFDLVITDAGREALEEGSG